MAGRLMALTIAAVSALAATLAVGATATFAPVGSATVSPGTDVIFTVTVSVGTLGSFDSADIVVGSNDAADVSFVYSEAWQVSFANITPPTPDVGLYAQDVFVGGNNPSPVGSTLALGIVTVNTEGMTEGTFQVSIDAGVGPDVSSLVLDGIHEDLQGAGAFAIVCPAVDPDCDDDVDLMDYRLFLSCLTGPGLTPSTLCMRYDTDGDLDVDFADVGTFVADFTGSK